MARNADSIPLSQADDLLCLDLGNEEKVQIIELASDTDNDKLESFFIAKIPSSHQNIGVAAFQMWVEKTEHINWQSIIELSKSEHLSQRIKYRFLDEAFYCGGLDIIESISSNTDFLELSPAFHGILLLRALQWDYECQDLLDLASASLSNISYEGDINKRLILSSISYIKRYKPKELNQFAQKSREPFLWSELLDVVQKDTFRFDRKEINKPTNKMGFNDIWPNTWNRHQLKSDDLTLAFNSFFSDKKNDTKNIWETFSGSTKEHLSKAVSLIEDDLVFCNTVSAISGLLAFNSKNDSLGKRLEALDSNTLKNLPKRFYAAKNSKKISSEKSTSHSSREMFFNLAYREIKETSKSSVKNDYWSTLSELWENPDLSRLNELTKTARKEPHLYQLCFLETLGRFKDQDQARLKLLDYVRTEEEADLRIIFRSLKNIGTPQCAMELISAITRPNVGLDLQNDICAHLKSMDLSKLQEELRSAIKDLIPQPNTEDGIWELKDNLSQLLSSTPASSESSISTNEAPKNLNSEPSLDEFLAGKISVFSSMSSEVKRALRTAAFFHLQVDKSASANSIDLSPVVDMQYKAMELYFRELFEQPCKELIHSGQLQRKLDVIGYARPIPERMSQFEDYIGKLPVISSIPFFSKFKLRKMLRALCQFKPGKRFTLDGLKAFGLFFLSFGRKHDQHGLENLFPLPYESDNDLFQFCKKLHMFQDIRNRAAHEGFQPDDATDIDAIWQLTKDISSEAYDISKSLSVTPRKPAPNQNNRNRSQDVTIIRKKVS